MRKLLIVAVLGMVLAIAACGPGAEPTSTPTSTPMVVATPTPTVKPLATPTATPKRGGIVKVRVDVIPASFYILQTTKYGAVAPVYNGLLAQDPLDPTSDRIVPDLADRWEISGDGLTITLFLHQGVKWQDGVPFTATDVKYNLDLIRNPPTGFVSPRKDIYEAIASVEVPNDNTVVLKLKKTSQSIVAVLAGPYNVIMPKHLIEKDVLNSMKQVVVGTGPYQFKKLTPEGIVVHERNPQYWKSGLPYLDGIQIIPIADTNAIIAALYTGQIDTASTGTRSLSKTDVHRIQKERPELLVQGSVAQTSFQFFALNTKIPPFKDQRVRVAVQDSLDREEILNTSGSMGQIGGMARPGSYWALPTEELSKLPGYGTGPDISARRAQARQLLKDAGIAAGTEIMLSTKTSKPLSVEYVELMQLQLQEALPSLNVKIRNYSSAEFDAAEASSSLQSWFENLTPAVLDPDLFGVFITTGASRNYWGMSDPRIDELQLKQSTTLDPAQRRLVVWELDKLVIQNGALVPMNWVQQYCAAWPYVKNQVCTAIGSSSTSERYEIVWLDK